jgi:hypothetical protein
MEHNILYVRQPGWDLNGKYNFIFINKTTTSDSQVRTQGVSAAE